MPTKYEIAAMIGYYRMGAGFAEIAFLTGFTVWQVEHYISNYLKSIAKS